MYKIFKITLLALLFFNTENLVASDPGKLTKVEGKLPIEAGQEHEVSLRISDQTTPVQSARFFTIRSQGGEFKFQFLLSRTETIRITVDSLYLRSMDGAGITGGTLYIEPGDSLAFSVPTSNSQLYKDIIVTGKGSEKYRFMKAYNHALAKAIEDTKNLKGLEQNLELKRRMIPVVDKYKSEVSDGAFKAIKYYILSLYHYGFVLHTLALDYNKPESFQEYQRNIKSYPLEELVMSKSDEVAMEVVFFGRAKIDYLIRRNTTAWDPTITKTEYYSALETAYTGKPYQAKLLASYLHFGIVEQGLSNEMKQLVERFHELVPATDQFRIGLDTMIAKLVDGEKNGVDLATYNFVDTKGNAVSLAKYKGKVLLIDFYFFGCAFCKVIAPEMEKLEKQFENRDDLVFLSISIDATMQRFQNGIGVFSSPSATALFTGGVGDNHKMIRDFGISGYPTLVMIGRKGEVINNRAPVPRNEEETEKLINLIKQSL